MTAGQITAQNAVTIATFIKYTSTGRYTHTHTARIYVDREDPKVLQPFLYKENGDEGTMKVASFPPSKNQFKLYHS